MITGQHHVAVLCSDRKKALHFYETGLKFRIAEDYVRPERNDEILMMEGYGFTLELFIGGGHPAHVTGPEAYGVRHIALRVTEIEKEIERLAALGIEAEPVRRDTFNHAKMTFIKDPDGLPIELHE